VLVGRSSSVAVAVVGLILGACAASREQLRTRAAFDLDCPESNVEIVPLDRSSYGVRGCGQKATYVEVCNGQPGYAGTRCTWSLDATSSPAPGAPPSSSGGGARAPAPPRPTVDVVLRSDEPGLRFALYEGFQPSDYRRAALACATPCTAKVPPGDYRLFVEGPPESDVRRSFRRISIDGPVALEVDPPSVTLRRVGLAGGVIGIVAMTVGIGLVAQGSPASGGRSERNTAGAIVLLSGAAVTATGWTLYGFNGGPGVDRRTLVVAR
jgi:hypothetical protein